MITGRPRNCRFVDNADQVMSHGTALEAIKASSHRANERVWLRARQNPCRTLQFPVYVYRATREPIEAELLSRLSLLIEQWCHLTTLLSHPGFVLGASQKITPAVSPTSAFRHSWLSLAVLPLQRMTLALSCQRDAHCTQLPISLFAHRLRETWWDHGTRSFHPGKHLVEGSSSVIDCHLMCLHHADFLTSNPYLHGWATQSNS